MSLAQGLTWRCTPTLCLLSITLGRKLGEMGNLGAGKGARKKESSPLVLDILKLEIFRQEI